MSISHDRRRTVVALPRRGAADEGSPPGGPSGAAVATTALRRAFGSTMAVDGIDLAVRRGEIYGFLGPNGAGKSTTLRVLCTLARPTSGSARVAGYDVAESPLEVRIRIGAALQEAALDDRQTGRELLALQGRLYGLRPADIRSRVAEVLDLVAIGDAIDRRIGTYSGGMKRRLDLAVALVHNPEVLFLDEPTTGLDPVSRSAVWEEVRRLRADLGMTIFLTTQYLDEAAALADRVGIISKGRMVAEGPPGTLVRSMGRDVIAAEVSGLEDTRAEADVALALRTIPAVESVSVDGHRIQIVVDDGPTASGPVVLALHHAGVTVRTMTVRSPTLDDVFMELTGSHIREAGDR